MGLFSTRAICGVMFLWALPSLTSCLPYFPASLGRTDNQDFYRTQEAKKRFSLGVRRRERNKVHLGKRGTDRDRLKSPIRYPLSSPVAPSVSYPPFCREDAIPVSFSDWSRTDPWSCSRAGRHGDTKRCYGECEQGYTMRVFRIWGNAKRPTPSGSFLDKSV